jgi:transposase
MARTGRPKAPLTVTGEQRVALEKGARVATSLQAYALRCRIGLACAEPESVNYKVAAQLGISVPTVTKWRGRFIERGLPGLADEDRPGRPPSILLDKVAEVVTATLEETPRTPPTGRGPRWRSARPVGVDDRADLAQVRAEAAPERRVQAEHRSAVRGEGLRCRRPVPPSARAGSGAVCGREDAGAGQRISGGEH